MRNTKELLCSVAAITACLTFSEAVEPAKALVTERKVVPLPDATEIIGPLPRPVLMVKLDERGKHPGDKTDSSFWVFDPAEPEKGLRKVFSGPGQSQYLRFMTPLYAGWGVAYGRLDPLKEQVRDEPWFWFNLLTGEKGPAVGIDMWREHMDKGWLVGELSADEKDGETLKRIARYHPLEAVVLTTEMDFSYINWLNRSEILGVANLDSGEHVIRMDVESSEYEVIADTPPGYGKGENPFYRESISLAGEDARDGVYAVNGFTLLYRPQGGEWHTVIRDVHIVKTFGGAPPSLPVRYVGEGRFAVAKTVKDEVEVPDPLRNSPYMGAAEAVTMLIDGVTGKVLKESAPHIYDQNPRPMIPDDWWAPGFKPKPPEPEPKRASLFQWDEEKRELRFAEGKVMKLGEDDEHMESDDCQYLVVYQQCPRGGGKQETKVPFQIIDGKTGSVHRAEVTSDFYEVWVDPSWRLLCGESPDEKTLKEFEDAGPGP